MKLPGKEPHLLAVVFAFLALFTAWAALVPAQDETSQPLVSSPVSMQHSGANTASRPVKPVAPTTSGDWQCDASMGRRPVSTHSLRCS